MMQIKPQRFQLAAGTTSAGFLNNCIRPMLAIEQTGTYIAYTADIDAIGRQWLRDATALPP